MKKRIAGIGLGAMIMGAGVVYAGKPKHPNLAAAEKAIANAFEKLTAAQKANEWDLGGHAQKAKELLEQAQGEIKQAAEAANENKEKK
jgi:hypothetical protein